MWAFLPFLYFLTKIIKVLKSAKSYKEQRDDRTKLSMKKGLKYSILLNAISTDG